MNSKSLCVCGHEAGRHYNGCQEEQCGCLYFRPEPAPEHLHCGCTDRRYCQTHLAQAVILPHPDQDKVNTIINTFEDNGWQKMCRYDDEKDGAIMVDLDSVKVFFRTALISHRKAEREKGIQEEAIKCYEHSQASFTKGIEAAKEITQKHFGEYLHPEFCANKGEQFKKCALCHGEELLKALNSLKETNTK